MAMSVKQSYEIKFFNGSTEITDDSTVLLQGMLFCVYDKESGEYAEMSIRTTHTTPNSKAPDPKDPVDTDINNSIFLMALIACVFGAMTAFMDADSVVSTLGKSL